MEVWIGRDGERHGPYTEADVRQWLRSGEVSRDDLGWHEGMTDWAPLSQMFPGESPAATGPAVPPMPPSYAPPVTRVPESATPVQTDAGFWKRLAAYIVDALVLWVPNVLLTNLMGAREAEAIYDKARLAAGEDPQLMLQALDAYFHALGPAILAQTILAWLYFAFCESSKWQATPGKLALGIRVTDLHGARISFVRATGRYFAKFISAFALCIGFLMVAWTQRKQGLHDMIAQTLVVNGRTNDTTARPPRPDGSPGDGSFNA